LLRLAFPHLRVFVRLIDVLVWLQFVDFNAFTASSTNGVNGFAYGSCENRAAADLTNRQFAEYFNAAPTGTLFCASSSCLLT
jgi:hypothetical protein